MVFLREVRLIFGLVVFIGLARLKGLNYPLDTKFLTASRRLVDENICVRKKKSELEQKRRKYDLLTQREKDVVDLVSQGELNKVIADKLGITLFTVKIHRANACRKLECRSAVDISDFLRDIGIKDGK